jgi:hypothetical protein
MAEKTLNINQLLLLKNQQNEPVYMITKENNNESYIIFPLKPDINILDTLSICEINGEILCDINMLEVFVGALTDKLEKSLSKEYLDNHAVINKFIESSTVYYKEHE